jgi:hypothetical protein
MVDVRPTRDEQEHLFMRLNALDYAQMIRLGTHLQDNGIIICDEAGRCSFDPFNAPTHVFRFVHNAIYDNNNANKRARDAADAFADAVADIQQEDMNSNFGDDDEDLDLAQPEEEEEDEQQPEEQPEEEDEDEDEDDQQNQQNGKEFICTFPGCEKGFARKWTMNRHILTHTGDKQFVCAACDKGFYNVSMLHRHERVHDSQKNVLCLLCDKAFKSNEGRAQHAKKCNKRCKRAHNQQNQQNNNPLPVPQGLPVPVPVPQGLPGVADDGVADAGVADELDLLLRQNNVQIPQPLIRKLYMLEVNNHINTLFNQFRVDVPQKNSIHAMLNPQLREFNVTLLRLIHTLKRQLQQQQM